MSDPVSAALLSSGLKAGGSLIEWGLNRLGQKEAWAREDSAVQRRAKDMEAAGINPVMAAGSPAQSMPAMRADFDIGDPVGQAMQAAKVKQDIAYTEAQRQKTLAEAREANVRANMMEYTDSSGSNVWSSRTLEILANTAVKLFNENQRNKLYEDMGALAAEYSAAKSKAEAAQARDAFMAKHADEFNEAMLTAQKEGASQEEIRTKVIELAKEMAERDKQTYWWDKGFGYAGQILGGAARAGMTYAGISSGMLNQAKRLTPSEY